MNVESFEKLYGSEFVRIVGDNFILKYLRINIHIDEAYQKILDFVLYDCDKLTTNLLLANFWKSVINELDSNFIVGNIRFVEFLNLKVIIETFFFDIYPKLSDYDLPLTSCKKLEEAMTRVFYENGFTNISQLIDYILDNSLSKTTITMSSYSSYVKSEFF
ncbi:hypothetical protein BLOT_016723 [Blomia tropicalis]|nr:hypothetical protein BLOT_016723 [Blomia tropicalis]